MATDSDITRGRREFVVFGAAAAGAAFLAACGKSTTSGTAATTTTALASASDAKLLRTASSIEELEVAVYQRALDGGVIRTPALLETVKLLQAQHKSHAALFEGHTSRLGGQPFTNANPVLQAQFQSRVAAMTDEGAFIRLAFDLAQLAGATYQAAVGNVDDKKLNLVLMSVVGVEARHAAVYGGMIGQVLPTGSIATTEKAVARGTGV